MIKYFEDDVGLVAGVVDYRKTDKTSSIFQGIQHLDFFSHTACSAGAIAIGKANNTSGANYAYRKSAYREVEGFSKIVHPTGDDSFFSQLISRKTKWKTKFAISKGTNVSTLPMLTLRQFINQRIRWASQGAHYPIETVVFLISTFFMFVIILFTLPATIILKILSYPLPETWSVPLFCFLIKGIIDFLILLKFSFITKKVSLLKFFPITEIIHIPYILISALGGYFMKFEWKGFEAKKQ
jgi:cellulose synthase/poly-beta-1,6-N-acetylglucosamine synthase-like glycosyltransferase